MLTNSQIYTTLQKIVTGEHHQNAHFNAVIHWLAFYEQIDVLGMFYHEMPLCSTGNLRAMRIVVKDSADLKKLCGAGNRVSVAYSKGIRSVMNTVEQSMSPGSRRRFEHISFSVSVFSEVAIQHAKSCLTANTKAVMFARLAKYGFIEMQDRGGATLITMSGRCDYGLSIEACQYHVRRIFFDYLAQHDPLSSFNSASLDLVFVMADEHSEDDALIPMLHY